MRKALLAISFIGGLVLSCGTAHAELPVTAVRVANEPAATLLLPYFEVALPTKIGGKPKGIDTLFSVTNASATAVLAHVTIWSDLAVPVTVFNIYLTGYDMQRVDMFEVLNGHLPRTVSAGQDPGDQISHKGPISQDINFASCFGQLPYPDPLPEESIQYLRAATTGKPAALIEGKCTGRDFGEKKPIARGYVTIDTVSNCTLRFPGDPGYFTSDITFQNVLWGDYEFINKSKKVGRGDALVHIATSFTDPATITNHHYTFYGRYNGFDASDHRQPLATSFAARFVNVPKHPVFPSGTSAIVWRDTKINQVPFTCGTLPHPFPLNQENLVIFDEQENPEIPVNPPIPPFPATSVTPFTAAAQIVKIGGPAFPVATPSGWIFFDLNTTVAGVPSPPINPGVAQAWVTMVMENKGKYSASVRATTLSSAAE